MSGKHRGAYYMQFVLMLIIGVGIRYLSLGVYSIMVGFFFLSEFYLLEQSRKMDSVKIRYRKSAVFGIIDFFAVVAFLFFLFKMSFLITRVVESFGWHYLFHVKVESLFHFNVIIWYTFIRKFYIYKNLTYEK